MGVDITTYRCRVGMFVPHHGSGVLMKPLQVDFSMLVICMLMIGSVSFIRILLVMAGIEQNPGPADQHFTFRYQYLLIEIGTKVLRALFDNIVGTDIMKYLNANNKKQYKQLLYLVNQTKILYEHQKQHLPPIDMKPNSANFDITLLTCLLRNICGLCNHKYLVWTSPAPTDLSLEADITRLRECRNDLAHAKTVIIDEKDLQNKWQELTSILHRLNQKAKIADLASQINSAECRDIDDKAKQNYDEMIKSGIELEKRNIQKDILEMYKDQCKTLPVSPLIENVDEELLHIYQPPTMHSVEPTKKETPRQIDSYEDIFCKDSKVCKSIYITGDAGVGKTSLCRRMCLLWYMAKCGEAESKEVLKKDVDYISKFDYVFCITLRETHRARVLDMIIEQFFGSNEKYEHLIKSILRDKQCLVLLDGMDEWSPEIVEGRENRIPERLYSGNCVYLTTCRPYRIESVRLSHKKDIDHQIQMTGISGISSRLYVKKLVNYLNLQESCNRKLSDFEKEVKKCGLNKQLSIPIITAHLVVLWYEKTLTGMPSAVIYGNILEMLFERAEKRKIQFPPSPPSTHQLPNSLTGLTHLNKYVSFIYKVCNLSFCTMFNQDENVMSLVFTRDKLESDPYFFSIEETDFLCKIGILSKNEVFGFYSKEKLKISFIHKSYLEFFAALFISSFDPSNSFNDVTKRWKSLDQVLPCENFLLLLAGFSYDGINQLFDNIYLQLSDDLTWIRRNAIYKDSYKTQLESLQNIVVNCFNEFSRSEAVVLKMEDFIFDYDSNVDILRQLLLLNKTCVKSIRSDKGKYYPEFDQIHCLQYLNVRVSSDDIVKFTEFMLQNKSTLHTVCIDGVYDKPLKPELPVRSLHHLTSLSLSFVKLQHLHDLVKFLSDNVLIENIQLSYVSCVNHQLDDSDCSDDDRDCTLTLNLPQHTKLTSLYLDNVNILCNNVNNSSLKSVTLCPLSERIVRLCYNDLFKCIKDSQLEHLDIYSLDNKTMKTLTSTVKSLAYIKSLRLWYMKLPDDVLLQLHPQVTRVKIKLVDVTMSRLCFHSFVESCVNISEIKVMLTWCQITSVDGETRSVLSVEESVKYMSEYLESISTINITHKGRLYKHDKGRLYFETRSCQ